MTTVTSTERPSTWSERLDPRNWSLVAKLAVVGLVPTVLALSIGAVRVVDQANVAEELGRGSGLVDVHRQIETLTGALQTERDAAVRFVAGNRLGDRAAVDRAQATTDQALQATTAGLDTAEQQAPDLATARRQADTTLGQLPVIRSQVAEGPTAAADLTGRYTAVVQRTLGLDRALVGRLQTADTAGLTTAIAAGSSAREALQLERTVIGGALAAGTLEEQQRAQATGAEASFQAAAGDFQSSLTPEQAESFGNFGAGQANGERNALRDQALSVPPGVAPPVDPNAWNAAVDRSVAAVDQSTAAAEQAFVDGRAAAAEQAGNTAGLNSVLLMLTILLTAGIILLLGRQMVRSLRLLRSSALEVAEQKLPAAVQSMRSGQAPNALVEPVPLDSRDEIGQVARAFDAVHGQAIRLAADQAALQQNVNSMFVNLSRRSQALVERQLQLIEQLESNEQDPDQLSNLFQLDHLATRMRRNSENLLVLAGTDLAKRNVAPVQVVDVLRAAVSEVEQYQRVVVQTPPNATIAGRAANDLVHLLAELLDNATNFSPPDSQVVMSTTRTADESLLVEISDRGVGMTDSELVDANQRLSGPAEVDVSASRRMGLFVVGRLAARHRVGVRLASAAVGGGSGGLSASVTVPPQLVPSAQLPEQRRDGDPGGWGGVPPQGGEQAPQLPAPALTGGGAPDGPRPDSPVAVNGNGRGGSLPSMVAGSDGPMTPTFETGTPSSTTARNGSGSSLPTRRPGSSLTKNAAPGDAGGQTADGSAPTLNGSAPQGLSAFAPSQDGARDGRTPADVFTPADEAGSGPADGDAPRGAEAFRGTGPAPSGDGDGPSGDAGTGAGSVTDTEDTEAAVPADGTDHADTDGDADRSGGTAAPSAAAALGLAGAAAAAAAARARADRDMDDTVVLDRAIGDGPEDHGRTPADDEGAGVTDAVTEAGPDGTDPDTDGSVDPRATDEDTDRDADRNTEGTAPEQTPLAARTNGIAPFPPAPGDRTDASTADGHAHDGTGAADAAGTDVSAPSGRTPSDDTDVDDSADTTGAGHTGPDPDEDDTTGAAASTDDPGTGADRDRPADTASVDGASVDGGSGETGSGDGRSAGTDPETAALPTIRPSGRTPMGGPLPARTNGSRPSPSRRPVMPARGAGPALPTRGPGRQGPSPAPARGPQQPAPRQAQQVQQAQHPEAPQERPVQQAPGRQAPAPLPKREGGRAAGPAGLAANAAGASQDELFAPKVPVEGDRGQLRRPGAVESARAQTGFDMGQTTPIFDDIASAWFRSNRSVPVRWQDGAGPDGGAPAGAAAPAASDAPAPPSGFASPADDVWRQAREATDGDESETAGDDLTTAGLPKRRPRARLLPGSAAGSTVLSPAPAEPRDAESVRGRLASYQQGVRQGRESASGVRRNALAGTTDTVDGDSEQHDPQDQHDRQGTRAPQDTTATGTPEPAADRPNSSDPEENQ
ncbi:nitrate- and nitrite sensing domain-containing protein [Pseudonocardia sp. DR1-2]|uniref:nitrate- and nitrite sensing domain-containing protein n=1 Tax=Pseudonocardia sp. DR1-2 TaxID=2951168 RepID=UPI0020443497|nr:nitrate- and nitrite sensing domain-containing protein [Pseudonocardia sp. DR1-2]MCM3845453.1 nitrate- and nitrite sensing domain-containing protein [Pseudonocardia sp. DR1-2]